MRGWLCIQPEFGFQIPASSPLAQPPQHIKHLKSLFSFFPLCYLLALRMGVRMQRKSWKPVDHGSSLGPDDASDALTWLLIC